MSKRYPPIYSIVALIALVTIAATNTNGAALYVASTIVKTLATLTSNIANYLGFVLTDGFAIVASFVNMYAVFCLHVIIIAIYCKMLFSKRAKEIHNTIKQTLVIDDRLLCVLNEFSVLAHGHAMCNYWSYE